MCVFPPAQSYIYLLIVFCRDKDLPLFWLDHFRLQVCVRERAAGLTVIADIESSYGETEIYYGGSTEISLLISIRKCKFSLREL